MAHVAEWKKEEVVELKGIIDKYDVDMPIVNAVYKVIFEGENPRDMVNELMTREKKSE